MQVLNIHEREFLSPPAQVGLLLDSLASSSDRLWPRDSWPAMRMDRHLTVGAVGGHGPIKYFVEKYSPGRYVQFRFIAPAGFDGYHAFEIIDRGDRCVLRHSLKMHTRGQALLSWSLVFRPLHDALVEDALTKAQLSLNEVPKVKRWSKTVRLLRHLFSKGKASAQTIPGHDPNLN